jgi:hypothetical protein
MSRFNIKQISLEAFNYDRQKRVLTLGVYSGFPKALMVKSHHTGKEVRFERVSEHDVLFSQDQWDGVQQIYRPIGHVPNVDHLVLFQA